MMKTNVLGANLFVIDDLNPEDSAMLQALYSRSAASVETHMERIEKTGSARFCEQFMVNYGHKSIADCGSTTLFIEGVSLLAAKAIQDSPMYSGQETSTRYINMSQQRIVDPVGSPESKAILDAWMDFYVSSQEAVEAFVRARYPMTEKDLEMERKEKEKGKPSSYEGAVKARVFDSLRGFLPAGITTQLSWHTNLRQAGDKLVMLTRHPSEEIQEIALGLRNLLSQKYPSSGMGLSLPTVSGVNKSDGQEARDQWADKVAYGYTYIPPTDQADFCSVVSTHGLKEYADLIASRPRGAVLPHFLADLGLITWRFPLDFGSFRDLQRHRNGVCRMPLLDTSLGFEPWYLEQLPESLMEKAKTLIEAQTKAITEISDDPVVRQYYTALGFRVPCSVTYGLPAAVYTMELRSTKTVHPTLRKVVHLMIEQFQEALPEVPLHVDMDTDDWSIRRGSQTITAK